MVVSCVVIDKRQVIDKQQASSTTYLCSLPHKGVGVGERGKCGMQELVKGEGEKGAANAVHKLSEKARVLTLLSSSPAAVHV